MTAGWIDTSAAITASTWWSRLGDDLHREAFTLEHVLSEIALGDHTAVSRQLTNAATELWTVSAVVRHIVDAVARGDGSFEPLDAGALARLIAGVGVGPLPAHVTGAARRSASSAFGDRGETGDREVRSPYRSIGATPTERGRHRVVRALADTGDARQIRPDEFGLVRLDNGRYVIVLPGVVDLSTFSPGWDRHHRSVRDLDRAAFGSSRSTGVAANPYARAVWDALASAAVPPGSEIMVVGHSFGADTALDLAAEPRFNGPAGFHVTHVVAAGYHSAPQLAHVPTGTEVLVLQNHRDVSVIVETIGESGATEAVASTLATIGALARFDPVEAVHQQLTSIRHQIRTLGSAMTHVIDRTDDLADIAVGVAATDPRRIGDGVTGFVTLEPGVRTAGAGRVVSVFDGGGDGFGHAPSTYVSYLDDVADPTVLALLASIDEAGYSVPGVALAVDVSVPG